MKSQRGITLIALIITIVVLLILAVVAIKAVQGDGIIAYAQNASTDYNQAQKEENDILQTYLTKLEDVEKSQKLIKFIVNYSVEQLETANVECVAERGMTWKMWVESDYYNPDSEILLEQTDVLVRGDDGVFWILANENDLIVENKKYVIYEFD